jgi:hypothetical protein
MAQVEYLPIYKSTYDSGVKGQGVLGRAILRPRLVLITRCCVLVEGEDYRARPSVRCLTQVCSSADNGGGGGGVL